MLYAIILRVYIYTIYIHRKCHANCKLSKSQFPALSKSSCGFQLKSPQLVGIVDGINGPLISGFCGYGGSRHFLWKLQHEESVSEYTVFCTEHWARNTSKINGTQASIMGETMFDPQIGAWEMGRWYYILGLPSSQTWQWKIPQL